LAGRDTAEVAAILGSPTCKLQTTKGAVWLYPEWRIQFDPGGRVLTVEKNARVQAGKLDSQYYARDAAIAKGRSARAAADDAARIRANAPAEKVRVISNGGQPVDLPSLLAEGKVTIVDFFAEWCGPCRQISPHLERLAKDDPDVVLVKIDIANWNTPVTQQFGIRSVPSMRVFNRARRQVGDATHDLNLLMQHVQQAKRS
jgi:thioredoxin 1